MHNPRLYLSDGDDDDDEEEEEEDDEDGYIQGFIQNGVAYIINNSPIIYSGQTYNQEDFYA